MTNLAPLAPMLLLTAWGIVLVGVEAYAKTGVEEQHGDRGYIGSLALIGIVLAILSTLGAWSSTGPTAVGGMIWADRFSHFFNLVFLATAGLTVLFAAPFLREHHIDFGEFYPLVLFATVGMMVMAAAADLVTLFLGLELMSIAVYVLAGARRQQPQSGEAALKYLEMGALASAFLLYGVALVYGNTGHTGFKEIAKAAPAAAGEPLFIVGLVLIMVAFAFKIAAVPFHMWAPDVYEGAPTPVTGFMAAGVKAAAFAVLIRMLGTAFGVPELTGSGRVNWVQWLAVLAAITMTVGNLIALQQQRIKRLLAYSSITHAGYLLVGVAACAKVGASARASLLYYLLAYAFTTLGAFGVVTYVSRQGRERLALDDYAGLGTTHPTAALACSLFFLSLAGIPPTGGFFGKFYVFKAALEDPSLTWLVVVAVMNSVIGVYYYLRPLVEMYMREPLQADPQPDLRYAPGAVGALVLSAFFTLQLGIFPGTYLKLAVEAVGKLVG
jgi:NADH-quinone oxidoreductase subunit N